MDEENTRKTTSSRGQLNSALGLAITICTTFILSVLVLAFQADASSTYQHSTWNGILTPVSSFGPGGQDEVLDLGWYPLRLDLGSAKPTLAVASIDLILSVALGLSLVFVHCKGKAISLCHRKRFIFAAAFGGICVLTLVVWVTCLAIHLASANFNPNYRSLTTDYTSFGAGDTYDAGTFDLMSWSCQVSRHSDFDTHGALPRLCVDESAALWITLPLALSNIGLTAMVWSDWKGPRSIFCEDDFDEIEVLEIA